MSEYSKGGHYIKQVVFASADNPLHAVTVKDFTLLSSGILEVHYLTSPSDTHYYPATMWAKACIKFVPNRGTE